MKLTGINHLAFITADMEKTIRFYRDLLGFQLTAGIGHVGFRHYFFGCGKDLIAFFEYEGASPMETKSHGTPTRRPLGFDHVSYTIGSREELYELKDRLEAAGFEVRGAVDHGIIWSIYFYDPNNIPLEVSWNTMEITKVPAMDEAVPMEIVAEGAEPQPGHWPEPTEWTAQSEMKAWPGNAFTMRETLVAEGTGNTTADYEAVPMEERFCPRPEEAAE